MNLDIVEEKDLLSYLRGRVNKGEVDSLYKYVKNRLDNYINIIIKSPGEYIQAESLNNIIDEWKIKTQSDSL